MAEALCKKGAVVCAICRFASEQKLIAFTTTGFTNYKKAIERCSQHATSSTHNEAIMKFSAMHQPSIQSCLSSQSDNEAAAASSFCALETTISDEGPLVTGPSTSRTPRERW